MTREREATGPVWRPCAVNHEWIYAGAGAGIPEGWPCRCGQKRYQGSHAVIASLTTKLATATRLLKECQGQQADVPGMPLRFVVEVHGLGASPKTPREIALELCAHWTDTWARNTAVRLYELPQSFLAHKDEENQEDQG